MSGGFDKKIRLWNIPAGRVHQLAHVNEYVTSIAFSPDGKMVVAGLFHGQVIFYQSEGLRYHTQVECRNRHGKNKGGKKVTGLAFLVSSGWVGPWVPPKQV